MTGSKMAETALQVLGLVLLLAIVAMANDPPACDGPFERLLRFKVWGAGGGAALTPTGPPGGAGGFATGLFCQRGTLTLVVGGPGGLQPSSPGVCDNGGFPNGGCAAGPAGGAAGGGGGSSHVLFRGTVVLGAGGGGGGAYDGAGGGGGTCNGAIGFGGRGDNNVGGDGSSGGGGAGSNNANPPGRGSCGGGDGGVAAVGKHSNGAGGATNTGKGGGGGGAGSCALAIDCAFINASSPNAVALAHLPSMYSTRTPGATDTPGAIILEDAANNEVLSAYFEPGEYAVPSAITPDTLEKYIGQHFRAYHECALMDGTYNLSAATCQLQSSDPESASTVTASFCKDQSAAFVGLGPDGSLMVCLPANQSSVHVGGTLRSETLDQLHAENLQLRQQVQELRQHVSTLAQAVDRLSALVNSSHLSLSDPTMSGCSSGDPLVLNASSGQWVCKTNYRYTCTRQGSDAIFNSNPGQSKQAPGSFPAVRDCLSWCETNQISFCSYYNMEATAVCSYYKEPDSTPSLNYVCSPPKATLGCGWYTCS